MKLTLITVGRTTTPYLAQGIDNYTSRIAHYLPMDVHTINDVRSKSRITAEQQKELEGRAILAAVEPGDFVVLLDERGTEFTSREFAGFMQKRMSSGVRRTVFIVGGPYGFSADVYARADSKISLSRMTFSHEMVRLFFVEQVYRAMTILRGEPYHHD